MAQLIGEVLHERYHIQSLLGRQTGRRTLLASDLQTGASVVIKLLLFGPDFTWDDLKLFEREAEVLKSLAHPAIPKYLDYFEAEIELGKCFALVQTYIEAKSLQNWVQSGRTFSEEELKAIAKELLGILDYLHSRQPPVVHRDIKPTNILLGDRSGHSPGQVYLIDFGSVQTAAHGGTRTVVGTYGYMPLEQFSGQSTPTSDLYALGATLIYLVTGQHPDQLPQREMRILFEDRVNLSPHLVDWMKWLTEPSTDLRLKSTKQALEAIEKLDGRLTTVAKPIESKLEVTNTRQGLEILIPCPKRHFLSLCSLIWHLILLISLWMIIILITIESIKNLGNLSITHTIMLFATLLFIWVSFENICNVIPLLSGQRLRITPQKVILKNELFGVRSLRLPLTRTLNQEKITRVEYLGVRYTSTVHGTVASSPHINIWAANEKLTIGIDRENSRGENPLTDEEFRWLEQVLNDSLKFSTQKKRKE